MTTVDYDRCTGNSFIEGRYGRKAISFRMDMDRNGDAGDSARGGAVPGDIRRP